MRYVLDASAVIDLLVRSDRGEAVRGLLTQEPPQQLVTVAHLDAEVLSGLARLARSGFLDNREVGRLLRRLASLEIDRAPITGPLLAAAWRLRANIATRDALYVAVAEAIKAVLVTTDDRLARAVPHLVRNHS